MSIRNFASFVAAGCIALAGPTAAFAQETLKWAHVYETGSAYHQAAEWAAEEIKERTEGRVEINVFPASSLGKEVEINEGLGLGAVDIIYTGPSFVERYYGPIAISDYPFIMRGWDHWLSYRGSDLFAELSEGYHDATGNQVLGLVYYGSATLPRTSRSCPPKTWKG